MMATRDTEGSGSAEATRSGLVIPLDSLSRLMTSVLSALNRENELESTLTYLHSEWLSTEADLREAMRDEAAWNALKIPSRLKIAIKNELRKVSSSGGAALSTPTSNASNTTTAAAVEKEIAKEEDNEKETPITSSVTDTADKQESASHEDEREPTDATQSWIKCFSPEHCHYYYYNEVTEASEWDLPEGVDETAVREDDWSQQTVAALFSEDGDSQIVDNYIAGLDACGDEEAYTAAVDGEEGVEGEELNRDFISRLKLHANTGTGELSSTRLPVPSAPLFLDEMSASSTSVSHVETIPSVEATPINSPNGTMAFTDNHHAVRAMPIDEYYADNGGYAASGGMVDTERSEDSYEGLYHDAGSENADSEESDASEYDDTDTVSYDELEDTDASAYADVPIDPLNLQMLMDMGFPEEDAAVCLQRTGNDITDATSLCLLHQKRREQQGHVKENASSRTNSAQSSPSLRQHSPTTSTLATASQYIARLERADTIAEGDSETEGKKKKTVRQRLSKIASKVLSGNIFGSTSSSQGSGRSMSMGTTREDGSEESTDARTKAAESKGGMRLI